MDNDQLVSIIDKATENYHREKGTLPFNGLKLC